MASVLTEAIGPVFRITLNNPATLNALDSEMAGQLREAVRRAADPASGFRCLLLTGAGRGFCSGGSLGMIAGSDAARAQSDPVSLGTHHHYVLKLLRELPYPVITAVNGPAAGLGFSYALAGDMVVAARSAYFLAAFSKIGVSPDGGLSWMLPKLVGWAKAKELLLLGRRLPAEQALEWGLVNRVFDDDVFDQQSMALAGELARGPTQALARMRRLLWQSWESGFAAQLDDEERLQLETFSSEDAREGALAAVGKRDPEFHGR